MCAPMRQMTIEEMKAAGVDQIAIDRKMVSENGWLFSRGLEELLGFAEAGRSIPSDIEKIEQLEKMAAEFISITRRHVEACISEQKGER